MRYCKAAKRKRHSIHARIRGLQRIGVRIGPKRYAQLLRTIRDGKAEHLSNPAPGIHRYRVRLWGEDIVAVFDRKSQRIATVWRYADA